MKLVMHDVASALAQKCVSLAARHDSWRCIHISFAAYHKHNKKLPRKNLLLGIVSEMLKSDDGFIYYCNDGDLILLFEGKIASICNRLGAYFQSFKEGPQDASAPLHTIFDLSKDWPRFVDLCEQKSTAIFTPPSGHQANAGSASSSGLPDINSALYRTADLSRDKRKQPLVLIVEDDSFTRRLVNVTLKNEAQIIEAATATEGMLAFSRHAPDIVFLDIELPDASGHAVLKKLLGFNPDAFVVMLSANTGRQNVVGALEHGAQGFVAKPFSREKLLHYMQAAHHFRHTTSSIPAVS